MQAGLHANLEPKIARASGGLQRLRILNALARAASATRVTANTVAVNRARRTLIAVGLVFGIDTSSNLAFALGANGTPINTSDYTVDFHEGPVLQSSRVIGLAGSVAPLAEGVIGFADNPATAALRVPWSNTFFDWELSGSVGSPALLAASDFDNNGSLDLNGAALFVNLGAGLQFGDIGLGMIVDVNEYPVKTRDAQDRSTQLTVSKGHINLVLANLFMDGQLAVGAGIGAHTLDMSFATPPQGIAPGVASVAGTSLQLGAVWSPTWLPIRAAASARVNPPTQSAAPADVKADAQGNYIAQGYYFPARITPPTVLQAAVTMQFFRRLNGPWISPPKHRGGEHPLPPEFTAPDYRGRKGQLQVTAGIKATLPVKNGVGMESFLRQQVERSGRSTVLSPRLGIEGEPWINGLVLRGGSYFEPSRFDSGTGRFHGTLGMDVHIPVPWTIFGLLGHTATFRIGGALDRAPRYFGWSASIGLWH